MKKVLFYHSYDNNKFKISTQTWNDKLELPNGSYSVSDVQYYLEYILKEHVEKADNLSIKIYTNKIENRIASKIKTEYFLELLTPETMKLLWNTENKITKDKNGDNVPHLEIAEVLLVHCNIVNNDYQLDSRFLHTLVPNKPFGSLLEISPTNFILLKTFSSDFSYIEVWFTDQNNKPLKTEDRINLALVSKWI